MTPKEKAIELVEKLKKVRNKYNQYYIIPITDDAIPLAIICVDELINDHLQDTTDSKFYYWQEVLTHLKEML